MFRGIIRSIAHNINVRKMALENQDPHSMSSAMEPLKILGITFLLGGLAGLAALLRSTDRLTRRAICSAILNSSLLSMGSAALWWWYSPESNFILLMAVSILIGLGGNTSIGIVTAMFQKKFNIVIADQKNKEDGQS